MKDAYRKELIAHRTRLVEWLTEIEAASPQTIAHVKDEVVRISRLISRRRPTA